MNQIAEKEIHDIIDRLGALIRSGEDSLRQLCERTMLLDAPERIHHSTLSNILNHRPSRNLYLQQFLMLLKLLDTTPQQFFLGKDTGLLAEAMDRLPKDDRQEVLEFAAAKLEQRRSAARLVRKLREG